MSSDVVIRAKGLGKRYVISHQRERERYTALRDVMARNVRGLVRSAAGMVRGRGIAGSGNIEEFWALKDLNFEIRRSEVVGIIGRNGAGKSTLLKVLSRITEPSEGRVEVMGRVASLLEVGTGFHPELTGRENIYLNGAILGMPRAEIRRKFDEIVAFAEVERFLDTPVKRYSSGMYVRLAFAVAAHLEPEILVVDEVLAVGDAEFQKKCLGKMRDVSRGGRTVLFVSHNMAAVRSLTQRSIWMDGGAVCEDGPTAPVVHAYLSDFERAAEPGRPDIEPYRRERHHGSPVRIRRFWVNDAVGLVPTLAMGQAFVLTLEIETELEIRGGQVTFELKTDEGTRVTLVLSLDAGFQLFAAKGRHKITCAVDGFTLTLPPGRYLADAAISGSVTAKSWDVILNYPLFAVADRRGLVSDWPDRPWAAVHCHEATWNLTSLDRSLSTLPAAQAASGGAPR